jgi:hypothetical protein
VVTVEHETHDEPLGRLAADLFPLDPPERERRGARARGDRRRMPVDGLCAERVE